MLVGGDEVPLEDVEEAVIKEFMKTFGFDKARVLTSFDYIAENLLENELLVNSKLNFDKDKDLLI
ncbi:MAG: hypothetical protein N2A97_03015 [Thermodesulfobacteriales bacterium]